MDGSKVKKVLPSTNTLKDFDGSLVNENLPGTFGSLKKQILGSKENKNLRRTKRSLMVENNSAAPVEKEKRQDEMLGMLKDQHELLQKFQEEIKNLRAEVRSQAASECEVDCTPSQMIKPISNRLNVHTPSRRLYPNICPGTAPSKRKRSEMDTGCWTPQVNRKVNAPFRRRLGSVDELPHRGNETPYDEEVYFNFNQEKERYDDEKPALAEDGGRRAERNIHTMKQQSLFEKVQTWQNQSIGNLSSEPLQRDKDGFKIPLVTPRAKKQESQHRKFASRGQFNTPNVNWTSNSCLQFAPKKKEPTKRRRPITSSDEGFYDEIRTREETSSSDMASGIRRTLSFDGLKEQSDGSEDEAELRVVHEEETSNEVEKQCYGCKPAPTLSSCTLIEELESHHYTCSFHQEFARKLLESYEHVQQQQQQQQQPQPQPQPQPLSKYKRTLRSHTKLNVNKVPKKSLTGKNRDWDSMSVFSYRSTHSQRSCATEKSVRSLFL